jgi:nicotinate-nucleotide adenylyltransferase
VSSVGIFGGTFNPPHIGHLICAQEAMTQLGLDRVVFMPVHAPPHKEIHHDPGPEARLKLCVLATDEDDRLEVSDIEIERGGTSYTVDTLRELHETAPEDDLTLIVGGDVAQGLATWREPEEVLSLARLAVTERAAVGHAAVLEAIGPLADSGQIDFFEMLPVGISSSSIRERVSHDEPIRYLVPDVVREEIERNGWYT